MPSAAIWLLHSRREAFPANDVPFEELNTSRRECACVCVRRAIRNCTEQAASINSESDC